MNISFLSKVLQANSGYWVVLKRGYADRNGRQDESIWFFGLGSDANISLEYEEVRLKDIEWLANAKLANIPLHPYYPPFQEGINMYDAVDGFPVIGCNVGDFLAKAMLLKSANLHDYQKLYKEFGAKQLLNALES